jgi:serine/threonine protein kinase
MKSVRRDNPRAEQFKRLRQQRLPTSAHTPLSDRLNTTEAKIRKEIAIMKKCRHPHVVRLYEVIDDRMKDKIYMGQSIISPPSRLLWVNIGWHRHWVLPRPVATIFLWATFGTYCTFRSVMEYLEGGEVNWRNQNDEPILKVEQTRRIIRDAVLGLEYRTSPPTSSSECFFQLRDTVHHQGIIHRDIKPANLLWTKDRSHVKIADFGVSHFSYAQRLAAAGKDGVSLDDPEDPILLDDSDLTRRAGTPSFLAPEIVYEHTYEAPSTPPSECSGTPSLSTRKRPQITKAIDVWALGVTLYCLLFGKTPFIADPATPANEWSLYNSICNNDWAADETMGSDQIPTGGRHPVSEKTEGGMVLHLLDHFLEKDVKLRITLEEVKVRTSFSFLNL